jgi:hypothetical protein
MRNLTMTWRTAVFAAPLIALEPSLSEAAVIQVAEGAAPVKASIFEAQGDVLITEDLGVTSDILIFRFNPISQFMTVCLSSNADELAISEDDFRCKPTNHLIGTQQEADSGPTIYTSPLSKQDYAILSDGADEQAVPEPASWMLFAAGLIGICFGRNRFSFGPARSQFRPEPFKAARASEHATV